MNKETDTNLNNNKPSNKKDIFNSSLKDKLKN